MTDPEIQAAQLAAVYALLAELEADVWAMTSQSAAYRLRRALAVCPTCKGRGQVTVTSGPDSFGNYDGDEVDCADCGGTGLGRP